MRGLRPSLGAAGSLLAAAAGLWLLASALLGFHAWPGGPGDGAPGVARLPDAPVAVTPVPRTTAVPTPVRRAAAARPPATRVQRRPAAADHRTVVPVPSPRSRPNRTVTPPAAGTPAPAPPSAASAPAASAAPATSAPGPVARAVATVTAPVASVVPVPVQTVVNDAAATVDGLLGR